MVKEILIIGLVLILLYSLYWNYHQRKARVQSFNNFRLISTSNTYQQQRIRQLETQIHHTDRNIIKARKDFWNLRLLINEWTVFKGYKEIKELVEQMRNNEVLEEVINYD
jgi:hypothetical protein